MQARPGRIMERCRSSEEGEPERNVRLLLAARRAHASPTQLFVSHIVHHRLLAGPVSPLSRARVGVEAGNVYKQAEAVAARQTDPSWKAPRAVGPVRQCFERGGPPLCHHEKAPQADTRPWSLAVQWCATCCEQMPPWIKSPRSHRRELTV